MKVVFLAIFLLCSLTLLSQKVYEIDYSNVGQSLNCNVFSSPVIVSNFTHQTSFGLPKYGVVATSCGVYDCVSLQNSSVFTSTSGDLKLMSSGYSIAFNFKKDCHYEISILGRTKFFTSYDGLYSNVGVKIGTSNEGTNATCNAPFVFYSTFNSFSTGLLDNYFCNTDFKWVTPLSVNLAQDGNFLIIAGLPNGRSGDTYTCIRKIRITETPKIQPASIQVLCGSSSPVTFTVTTGNNQLGVTGYNWDLGSANNGWLYNNNPAPQIISSATNTLQLTPVCGSTQSNVSASINTSNGIFAAGISTVTSTLTGLSISGNPVITNNENYTIANLPCNASVTWSVNPSGVVNTSCTNCNQTNLSRITDGYATLSASITNACGLSTTLSKNLSACNPGTVVPTNLTGTLGWISYYYGYNLYFNTVPNATSYYMEWYDLTDNKLLNTYDITASGQFYYYFTAGHTYKYRLAANLGCGARGNFSDWSDPLLPSASCVNGPLSSTLAQSLGCGGGGGCTTTNVSWPAVFSASQYKVDYRIHNISGGINGPAGNFITTSPNSTIYFGALTGTGWTITYRVSAYCNSFGTYSDWSSNFFLQ